jgi:hypothetical protein
MYGMQNNKIDSQQTQHKKKEMIGIVVGGTLDATIHANIAIQSYPAITCLPILGGVPGLILLGVGTGGCAGYKYMRGEFSVSTTNKESKK